MTYEWILFIYNVPFKSKSLMCIIYTAYCLQNESLNFNYYVGTLYLHNKYGL